MVLCFGGSSVFFGEFALKATRNVVCVTAFTRNFGRRDDTRKRFNDGFDGLDFARGDDGFLGRAFKLYYDVDC